MSVCEAETVITPGEDRSGARRVDDAEAEPDQHARAEALAAADGALWRRHEAADPGLEAGRDRGDQQRDAEAEQDDDRDVAQQVARQAERVDHVDEGDDREGEGEDEAGDDTRAVDGARR